MKDMTQHPLWQEQVELEARMVSDGADAFRASLVEYRQRGAAGDIGGGRFMVQRTVAALAEALDAAFAAAKAAKRGRRIRAVALLDGMDTAVLSFITIKTTLGSVIAAEGGSMVPVQRVAEAVGKALEAEAMVYQFTKAHAKLADSVLRRLDRTTSHSQHRRRVLMAAMRSVDFAPKRWSADEVRLTGIYMLDLAITHTGLIASHPPLGRSTGYRLCLSDLAMSEIEKRDAMQELLSPRLMPCVVPPKDWDTSGKAGGYWGDVTPQPLTLVKSATRTQRRKSLIPETVVASVNALQDTPWVINHRVLEVMREVVDRGLDDIGVLPPLVDKELPQKPDDIDTNEEARKRWRKAAAMVHGVNASSRSKRFQVVKTLSVAEQFEKYERIYFPHQLDFRGRAYAMPLWLNPQGPDYAKGLLTFAEGKPIGDTTGPGWLAIHGAGCFGVDKVSLEDRIQWVEENETNIVAAGREPLSNLFWTEADKPWQFLAFCIEWTLYRGACDRGEGQSFVSRLPVMVDGTCNGLQHYSAILRDPVGGAATNLVPADKPNDIYAVVAERVMETLRFHSERDDQGQHEIAYKWLAFGIDRKITKRPVMVLPYGGTFTSCREYVEAAVRERGPLPFPAEQEREALLYLAHVVWNSIGEVVVAARAAMGWLQEAARVASNAGIRHLSWVTPSGFEVSQFYTKSKLCRLRTAFCGSAMVSFNFEEDTNSLNKKRQATALSPNFVHSMDASAMHMTVETATANGITTFSMVHDSYGTVAADAELLGKCLRAVFVAMYEDNDVLEQFRDRLLQTLPEEARVELPELPLKGTLDLSCVYESDFFFA